VGKERVLVSLEDITRDVRITSKRLVVEVCVSSSKKYLKYYQDNIQEILEIVKRFYQRMKVNLDIRIVNQVSYFKLKPAEYLAVEILPLDEWTERNCQLFGLKSKFQKDWFCLKAMAISGIAHLKESIALICVNPLYELCRIFMDKTTRNKLKAANIIHELGHLMGLFHSHYLKSPVSDQSNQVPNFMSSKEFCLDKATEEFPEGIAFDEYQVKLIHSYLEKGRVYQLLKSANFSMVEYIKMIKEVSQK